MKKNPLLQQLEESRDKAKTQTAAATAPAPIALPHVHRSSFTFTATDNDVVNTLHTHFLQRSLTRCSTSMLFRVALWYAHEAIQRDPEGLGRVFARVYSADERRTNPLLPP